MNGKPQRYALTGMGPRKTEEFVRSLPPDEPLVLIREPDNAYDKNAIQVWARGRHVGYIPRATNAVLARFIDAHGAERYEPQPPPTLATDGAEPPRTLKIVKAVDARLHMGSNTWPLVEVV